MYKIYSNCLSHRIKLVENDKNYSPVLKNPLLKYTPKVFNELYRAKKGKVGKKRERETH